MPASTLTSKGQLTLPKTIREQLGLRAGDRVEFRVTGSGQVVVEAATLDLRDLRGALKARLRGGDGRCGAHGRDTPVIGLDTNVLVRYSVEDDPDGS